MSKTLDIIYYCIIDLAIILGFIVFQQGFEVLNQKQLLFDFYNYSLIEWILQIVWFWLCLIILPYAIRLQLRFYTKEYIKN